MMIPATPPAKRLRGIAQQTQGEYRAVGHREASDVDQLLWNRRILAGTRYGVAPFVAAEQLGQQFCAQPPTVACRPVDVQPRYHPLTYRSQAAVARTLASSRSLSAAASPLQMQGDLGAECVQ